MEVREGSLLYSMSMCACKLAIMQPYRYSGGGGGFGRKLLHRGQKGCNLTDNSMGSDVEKPAALDLSAPSKQEAHRMKPPRECFCRLLNIATAICALLCLVRI